MVIVSACSDGSGFEKYDPCNTCCCYEVKVGPKSDTFVSVYYGDWLRDNNLEVYNFSKDFKMEMQDRVYNSPILYLTIEEINKGHIKFFKNRQKIIGGFGKDYEFITLTPENYVNHDDSVGYTIKANKELKDKTRIFLKDEKTNEITTIAIGFDDKTDKNIFSPFDIRIVEEYDGVVKLAVRPLENSVMGEAVAYDLFLKAYDCARQSFTHSLCLSFKKGNC